MQATAHRPLQEPKQRSTGRSDSRRIRIWHKIECRQARLGSRTWMPQRTPQPRQPSPSPNSMPSVGSTNSPSMKCKHIRRTPAGAAITNPDLVKQEIWALLITHYAVHVFITEAADDLGADPDRYSFTRTINVIRRPGNQP